MANPSGSCAIAFKEWAGVCDALADGRQSILLRKGGIREVSGPGAFVPEHDTFWLYPTAVHQAQQGLRQAVGPPTTGGPNLFAGPSVPIGLLARVEWVARVDDETVLPALEAFHVLTAETVRSRFHYRSPGLWILVARIWRREPAFEIAATAEHAGCKTWVILDEPMPTADLVPVLDDADWSSRRERLRPIVDVRQPQERPD